MGNKLDNNCCFRGEEKEYNPNAPEQKKGVVFSNFEDTIDMSNTFDDSRAIRLSSFASPKD